MESMMNGIWLQDFLYECIVRDANVTEIEWNFHEQRNGMWYAAKLDKKFVLARACGHYINELHQFCILPAGLRFFSWNE